MLILYFSRKNKLTYERRVKILRQSQRLILELNIGDYRVSVSLVANPTTLNNEINTYR